MESKPKPLFYIVAGLVVAGLIGLSIWRFGGKKASKQTPKIDMQEFKQKQTTAPPDVKPNENPAGAAITTTNQYAWVPADKLPPVKGASDYKKLGAPRVVQFAINTWAGWAPIIYANEGFAPKKLWKDAQGNDFQVKLVLLDDPVAMRGAVISGDVHIGWATVDMLPLLLEGLQKDSRTMPRVYQQIDWSNGGDGIVVRDEIKTMSQLKGKEVVLAQNSPSHFFLLNALLNAGVQPADVKFKFTKDAFQAAAAFNAVKSIAGCVSWAPDIYNLAKVKGNRLIVTTQTANKLIADVWFARADFAKDHPELIEGLVTGIFDAMVELKNEPAKKQVAKWMAAGYSMPEKDAAGMLGDAHWTNFAENTDFFMNGNNPTNFERTYDLAYFLYKKIGQISSPVTFDKIIDFSVLKKLATNPKYAGQTNDYVVQFVPASASTVVSEKKEILTKTVKIHFFPNSFDLAKKVLREIGGKQVEVAYDPNADLIVDEIGRLAGQYGAARIVIEGHTDGSMREQIPADQVKELGLNRANAVKQAVLRKFSTLKPNQFSAAGLGWDRPADPADPENHAKNRRVEVKVFPLESE
jgi:ABC-type nitrate/sulfonate/bicarbonate transport system substrate-binding protein